MKLLINMTFILFVIGLLISSEYQDEVSLFEKVNYETFPLNSSLCDSNYIMINIGNYFTSSSGILNTIEDLTNLYRKLLYISLFEILVNICTI